jgi:hypothetical protein
LNLSKRQGAYAKTAGHRQARQGRSLEKKSTNHVDVSAPELNRLGRSDQLEWENCEPGQSVFPTTGKTPRGIDEADNVGVKGTVDGVKNSHLCEGEVGAEQHDTDDEI